MPCDSVVMSISFAANGRAYGKTHTVIIMHTKGSCNFKLISFYTNDFRTRILANSEDPDEMPHNAALHQILYCLLRQNNLQRKKYNLLFENYYLCPLNIHNGHPHL